MKNPNNKHLLAHEMVHIKQQKREGVLKYLFKYVFSRDFRYKVEFEAYNKGSNMSRQEAHNFVVRRYK